MTFYDVVTEMGYSVMATDETIEISKVCHYYKDKPLVEIHIIFHKTLKEILGYIKPLREIFDLDDVSHIYKHYLEMEKDVKFFAERSKYDII